VRFLLDTHAILWWLTKNPTLSTSALSLLRNKENIVLVSAASAWEIATKARIGRLDVATAVVQNFGAYLARERFEGLPVSTQHGIMAGSLPGPHKDPFDRMLIAQALSENVPIISNDRAFDGYDVRRIW
jgi:PIN domain nuclease of toxin-antitoxin system